MVIMIKIFIKKNIITDNIEEKADLVISSYVCVVWCVAFYRGN